MSTREESSQKADAHKISRPFEKTRQHALSASDACAGTSARVPTESTRALASEMSDLAVATNCRGAVSSSLTLHTMLVMAVLVADRLVTWEVRLCQKAIRSFLKFGCCGRVMSGEARHDAALGLFGRLPERLLLNFLRKLSVGGLLRLMECSKALYCATNYNKIWKRICIKRWDGKFDWKGSWKLTALLPLTCDVTAKPPSLHVPQSYYDAHFPLALGPRHRRSTIPISQLTGTRQDVERVDARTLSVEEFLERFDRPNKPCIITHAMDDWPAMKGAWSKDALASRFRTRRFLTDEVNSRGHKMKMSLDAYFRYMSNNDDSDPVYLFDPKFVKHSGDKEGILTDYRILPYFAEDFFSLLSKKERPFYRWLVFGPERSGSCFHTDPYNTSAWNALVSGSKRWIMYPPGWTPPGVSRRGSDYDSPVPVKWFLDCYEENLPGAVECTQNAGEVIWVPSRWWHQVLNVTETIAVTQNLCNSSNWHNVWPEVLEDRPMAEELREKLFPVRPSLFPAGTTVDSIKRQKHSADE